MESFIDGVLMSAGLIMAIGAQNAFVLSCSIKKQFRFQVAAICASCDVILVFFGAFATGNLVAMNPMVQKIAALVGAVFLFSYGAMALYRALFTKQALQDEQVSSSLKKTVGLTFAITLLNPHVYLDTVLLLGGIAGQYGDTGKYVFAAGAGLFSWIWFLGIAIGGTWLARFFKNPRSWQFLDAGVCIMMWTIAAKLFIEVLA